MKTAEGPSDERLLSEAQGYYELNMLEDAAQVLSSVSPFGSKSVTALELRCAICAANRDWTGTLLAARDFVAWRPEAGRAWYWLGYSARRALSPSAAYEAMRPAAGRFNDNLVVDYNLACYAALSGHTEESRSLLANVFARDAQWLKMALKDEDLQSLRSWLAEVPPTTA
jgi:hypothetical protein